MDDTNDQGKDTAMDDDPSGLGEFDEISDEQAAALVGQPFVDFMQAFGEAADRHNLQAAVALVLDWRDGKFLLRVAATGRDQHSTEIARMAGTICADFLQRRVRGAAETVLEELAERRRPN